MLKYDTDPTKVVPLAKVDQVLIFSTKDRNTGFDYTFEGHDAIPKEPYFDITGIVQEISITESVYSMSVTGHILVIDAMNMFEEMSINGQEMVYIKLTRTVNDNDGNPVNASIPRYFYVSNMSAYDRESQKQLYKLDLVTPHAMQNLRKRIQRAYGYNLTPETTFQYTTSDGEKVNATKAEHMIYHIMNFDLKIPESKIFMIDVGTPEKPSSKPFISETIRDIKAMIPNWRPFVAIQWLLKNAVSLDGGTARVTFPWVAYETLLSGFRIEPWQLFRSSYGDLNFWSKLGRFQNKVVVDPFVYSTAIVNEGEGYYKELRRKILEFSTSFSFNKYEGFHEGSARSTNLYINPLMKTFQQPGQPGLTETKFMRKENDKDTPAIKYDLLKLYDPYYLPLNDYVSNDTEEDLNMVESSEHLYVTIYNSVLHGMPEESGQGISETTPYNYAWRAENSETINDGADGNNRYYWGPLADMIAKNSIWMEHTMKVFGDFALSPGIVVTVNIPKAIDPQLLNSDNSKNLKSRYMNIIEPMDEYISGSYVVTAVTHLFEASNYYSICTIIKDTSNVDLTATSRTTR